MIPRTSCQMHRLREREVGWREGAAVVSRSQPAPMVDPACLQCLKRFQHCSAHRCSGCASCPASRSALAASIHSQHHRHTMLTQQRRSTTITATTASHNQDKICSSTMSACHTYLSTLAFMSGLSGASSRGPAPPSLHASRDSSPTMALYAAQLIRDLRTSRCEQWCEPRCEQG